MVASICRAAALIVLVGTSVSVAAPLIPSSDLPGRERSRFVDPPGFREVTPRPPLVVPNAGANQKSSRKCRARKGKRCRS